MSAIVRDHNESISKFLDRYCDQSASPGYAVMLSGPWGSGKTWFIERYREKLQGQGKRVLYVSFYGVSKPTEIKDQFFAQIHPKLANPKTKIAWGIAKSFLKGTIKIDLDGDGKDEGTLQISIPEIEKWASTEGAILIFDDLERSNMKIEEALGFINQFVEHDGYRVIILANEFSESFKSESRYKEIKEKVIGRTFQIQPDVTSAIEHFLNEAKDRRAHSVLQKQKAKILEIFNRALNQNLRQLRQAIFDFSDLWDCLHDKTSDKNNAFQDQLIQDCFSLSMEFRSGAISTLDIRNLGQTDWSKYFEPIAEDNSTKPPSPTELALRQHGLDSGRPLALPSEAFFEFFETGYLSESSSSNAVRDSQYLADESTPSWRRLWYLRSLSDDEFEKHVHIAFRELTTSDYSELGELIHTSAIFLHLARRGLFKKTVLQIARISIETLNRSIANQTLIPPSKPQLKLILRDESAFGLGFTDCNSNEFRNLTTSFKSTLETARVLWVKQRIKSWMKLLDTDVDEWSKHIFKSTNKESWFVDDAVFHCISPTKFSRKIISLSAHNQQTIQNSFTERFNHPNLYAEWLILELPFLLTLRDKLKSARALNKASPKYLSHFSINVWFLPSLEKSIEALERFEREIATRQKH